MSIVLVIIGLIVGGILVGQSLISAAQVRAQITQIEKYNSAVNTFRSKFNAIPGDMPPTTAQQFGFAIGTNCNGNLQGYRDGNGLIDGYIGSNTLSQTTGETELFWVDISSPAGGQLIDTVIPNSGAATPPGCGYSFPLSATPGSTFIGDYIPSAKIGHGNFIYVYEVSGSNWFGVSEITSITGGGGINSLANITVSQSYKIDNKIDDGIPISGNVQALYITSGSTTTVYSAPNTTTAGGTSSSCYDTTTGMYSVTYNNGSGANCALSFKFN